MNDLFNPYPVMLVDCSHVYARNSAKLGWMQTSDGRRSGGLFGTIRSIEQARKLFEPHRIILCFDSFGGAERRREGGSRTYKKGRDSSGLFSGPGLRELSEWATFAGCDAAAADAAEADDVIAHLHDQELHGEETVILSGDADMFALLDPATKIFRAGTGPKGSKPKDLVWTVERFKGTYYGLAPRQWQSIRAIVGDSSDNLPGLRGYGPKKAVALLEKHGGCWPCVLEELDQMDDPDDPDSAAGDRVRQNLKAIRFAPVMEHELTLIQGTRDDRALDEFYARWEFESLRKERA